MDPKATILIVDDNISLCKTMSFILQHKGYQVATATGGREAIEKVTERPFDIIFMDIKMEPINGVETFKKIKKIRPDAVVMMMTAYAVEDLLQEAIELGAFRIFYKPLDMEKAVDTVKDVLRTEQGQLILVVDDDPAVCRFFKKKLESNGYKTLVAYDGEEAIDIARENAVDIIFIDMKMPLINGLETYLAIKAVRPDAVAIMMTGYRYEMADLVEQALNRNAYTCLYKPLDMEEVLKLVREIRIGKLAPKD